jgi:hypothetical protein
MNYNIDLFLQQGDTTGNKPVIDVLWNGNTVVSSYTISTALATFSTSIIVDWDWDELSFQTNDMKSQNNLEIVYKNKPSNDTTNEDKIYVGRIVSSEIIPDPFYIENPPPTGNIWADSYFVNKSNWIYSNVSIDGNVLVVRSDLYPILKDIMNPIIIKNSDASLTVNHPFTVITANTYTLGEYTLGEAISNVDNSVANLVIGESVVSVN